MAIKYTKHAEEMLELRGVDKKLSNETVRNPDVVSSSRDNTKIYLKDFGKNYLMLVIAEIGDDQIVVTLHWLARKRVKRV